MTTSDRDFLRDCDELHAAAEALGLELPVSDREQSARLRVAAEDLSIADELGVETKTTALRYAAARRLDLCPGCTAAERDGIATTCGGEC